MCLGALVTSISIVASTSQSANQLPIYAAYISDSLQKQCDDSICNANIFDGNELSDIVASMPETQPLIQNLNASEYEVLIGNATIQNNNQDTVLYLEITTSWRNIPIDELVLTAPIKTSQNSSKFLLQQITANLLNEWVFHIDKNDVLSATTIYKTIGASNYKEDLHLPDSIGKFKLSQSALYHDPMKGTITRYSHPDFADAVFDISVYPFSSLKQNSLLKINDNFQSEPKNPSDLLWIEMGLEREQVLELINSAEVSDFNITSIEKALFEVDGKDIEGLKFEVALNASSDPVYSTQFAFIQKDKIIKLIGNVPEYMMTELVNQSIGNIQVPNESEFMRLVRHN